jgi:hypothetical protein
VGKRRLPKLAAPEPVVTVDDDDADELERVEPELTNDIDIEAFDA